MPKIHNKFILVSTDFGQIIQKTLGEKGEKIVISKFIMSLRISCVLMVDYESILIYHNKKIDDLSNIV